MREVLKFYIPFALVVIAGFAVALWYADPAPPDSIRLATGAPGGAYAAFGERYRKELAVYGIDVELVESRGSVENVALLNDPASGVDVAFVQGASVDAEDFPGLESLGSLFREPIWIFVRAVVRPTRIGDLSGLRVAVGAPGSGTRGVAEEALEVNGLGEGRVEVVDLGGEAAAEALLSGEVDAAFFVTAGRFEMLRRLASAEGIRLMDLERAEAYARLYDGVSVVTLPQGALDLVANEPAEDLRFLTAVGGLVVRDDLHPAVVQLLLQIAEEVHRHASLFAEAGKFPSPENVTFPLSDQAWRHFERGPSFLRSILPYWAANLVTRLWVLLLPALALLFPFMRIAPPIFRWQVRRRVYRWYRNLRRIEFAARVEEDSARRRALLHDLEVLQSDVLRIRVPLAFAVELYHLRLHIQFVRGQLTGAAAEEPLNAEEQAGHLREASSH